ncbi:MAG: T9SS type A sorting domain-containing protein [Desulfobacteraceae bacterium]|nr:T9SS type A sorting domain-containing protein [Desulfobacteraceae bacterium]
MKCLKFLITSGIVLAIGVAITLYFLKSVPSVSQRTRQIQFQASEGTEEDPLARKRYEWFRLRDPATNEIPKNIGIRELNFVKKLAKQTNSHGHAVTREWIARGPYNIGGRTRALALDVKDENTIFAGGVSGGMWKSIDGGKSWKKTTAPDQLHSVSCITQNRTSGKEHIWYYGTGESYPRGGSAAYSNLSDAFYRGDGIFKSIDGGETWSPLPATVSGTPESEDPFDYVFGLTIFGDDSVFAATSKGLFKSMDGGASWEHVLNFGESYRSTEIAATTNETFYVTIGGIGSDNGVYRSDDGIAWEHISPPEWPDTTERTAIGIVPSNENIVYFFTCLYEPKTQLWKYEHGVGWTNLTANLPNGGGLITYGGHMMIVKVKPDDENVLFLGTVGLFRSTDGGQSFECIGAYGDFHVDQHAIVFSPSNPKVMFVGNDGGLFKTEDNLAEPTLDPTTGEYHIEWQSLNSGYHTSQFYSVAIDHGTPHDETILGGTQDNAFLYTKSSNPQHPWEAIFRGSMDGGFATISDSGEYFYTSQAGSFAMWRFDFPDGQLRWTDITPKQIIGGGLWLPPFVLDAHDQKIMYLPWRDQLWRNSDLTEIPYVFPPVTTDINWEQLENVTGSTITALGMSKGEPRRLYFATYDWTYGKLFKLDTPHAGQPIPEEITGSNFPYYPYSPSVSCIAVDPQDANKLLVVFPNYGVISIYATEDGGSTWSPVAGNLEEYHDGSGSGPSIRWVSILYVDEQPIYFAGTSVGFFSTSKLDSMNTVWVQEGALTIGNVVVDMIDIRQSDGFVVIGTHGNGVYSTHVTEFPSGMKEIAGQPESFKLLPAYPNPFNQATTVQFRLHKSGRVKLIVYNVLGEKIKTLIDGHLQVGEHNVRWSANDVSSGTYFIRLNFENFNETLKVLLLK